MLRVPSTLHARLESGADGGQVLSAHASAVNIAWSAGGLMALHGPGHLRAPFAAAIPDDALGRLPRGAPVWRRDGAIQAEGINLRWRGAAVVDTRVRPAEPDWCPRPLLAAAVAGSRGSALDGPLGRGARCALVAGLARRDVARFLAGARALIGLGPGLTPAGDDFLVGVLAVLHRLDPGGLAPASALRTAIDGARPAPTTTVAAEFLRHALDGLFAEPFVHLLTASTEEAARGAAQRLHAAGATSGPDALLGVAEALGAVSSLAPAERSRPWG
jgi:Protein of unknown function (DUF2877)